MPGPSTSLPRICPRRGSPLPPASVSLLFCSQTCQMGKRQSGGADSTCGAREQSGRSRPVAFVSLEVSGDVQKKDKDTVCIGRLMLDNAAVTSIPRIHGLMPQSCISCSRLMPVMSQVCSACFLSRGIQAKDADLLRSFSEPKERECGEPHSAPKVSARMRHAPSTMSVWKSLI